MGSWGTAVWVAFAIVIAVQATLITILLVTFAKIAAVLQALASDGSNGEESMPFPQE